MAKKQSRRRDPAPGARPATTIAVEKPAPSVPAADDARPLALLWTLAAALTAWSFGFTTMWASDLWWHLAAGRWMWTNRPWPLTDPWTYTHFGKPWMHHEWLSDIVYHAWAGAFGIERLVWWKWTVLVATFTLLFHVLRRLSGDPLAAFVAMLWAAAVGAAFFDIRPHLYSVFGYVLLLSLLLGPSRHAWLLPPIFLVWVNLHGGFFFGVMAASVLLAAALLFRQAPPRAPLLWLACVLAALLNPNGIEAYTYPLKYAFDSSSPFIGLGEWRPPSEPGGIVSPWFYKSIGVFGAAVVVLFGSGWYRQQPRLALSGIVLGALTLAMSVKSRRFIPLFGISQSLVLAPALALGLSAAGRRAVGLLPAGARRWAPWLPPALAAALGCYWLAPYPLSSAAFPSLTAEELFPVEAINFVRASDIRGKVFAYYNWGGYIHLRTDGQLRVFIDGRADTLFDAATYTDYVRVLGAQPGSEDIVWNSGADYVLWPMSNPAAVNRLVGTSRWRMLYRDGVSVILIRADLPAPPLRATPDSAWREMALGYVAATAERLGEAEAHFRRALELKPNLQNACYTLVRTQVELGRADKAAETLEACRRQFPDPARYGEYLQLVRRGPAPR